MYVLCVCSASCQPAVCALMMSLGSVVSQWQTGSPQHLSCGGEPFVQSVMYSTAYAQQSQVSHLKFPKEEHRPFQTRITPSEGTIHFKPSRAPPHEQSGTTDLAKYLIRKEMVSCGLLKFDDRPENYWAWKASFVNTTCDLNLSPQRGARFTDQMARTTVCRAGQTHPCSPHS